MAADSLQIVVCNTNSRSASVAREDGAWIEPEFLLAGSQYVRTRDRLDPHGVLDYLIYRVARFPREISGHSRRIFFCYEQALEEDLNGALQDLFFALSGCGLPLRRRLLFGCRSRLAKHHFRALLSCLTGSPEALTRLPASKASVFHRGYTGSPVVVAATGSVEMKQDDPLLVARDHIEFSQLADARGVLEEAILLQPMRKELHLDLLELYRSTRDREGFRKFLKHIDLAHNPVPEAWEAAINFFQATE